MLKGKVSPELAWFFEVGRPGAPRPVACARRPGRRQARRRTHSLARDDVSAGRLDHRHERCCGSHRILPRKPGPSARRNLRHRTAAAVVSAGRCREALRRARALRRGVKVRDPRPAGARRCRQQAARSVPHTNIGAGSGGENGAGHRRHNGRRLRAGREPRRYLGRGTNPRGGPVVAMRRVDFGRASATCYVAHGQACAV